MDRRSDGETDGQTAKRRVPCMRQKKVRLFLSRMLEIMTQMIFFLSLLGRLEYFAVTSTDVQNAMFGEKQALSRFSYQIIRVVRKFSVTAYMFLRQSLVFRFEGHYSVWPDSTLFDSYGY